MKPEELDDLMQKALDGQASPGEQSQLNAALESSPEVQARYRELQALFHDLRRLEDLEPPVGFAPDIARAVHSSASESVTARWAQLTTLRTWRVREWVQPSRVFAFALGAAACFVVMRVTERHLSPDADQVAGSMVVGGKETGSGVQASRRLDFEGGHAQLRTIAEHRAMRVEILLDCTSPVRLALQTTPGTRMRGFDRPTGGMPVRLDDTGVVFEPAARGRYVFVIESGTDARGFVVVTVGSGAQELRAELPVTVGEN